MRGDQFPLKPWHIICGYPVMKRKLILPILVLLWGSRLLAQESTESYDPVAISSVHDAAAVAKEIVKVSGKKMNFAIAEAQVPNAVAVLHQGKRYILYNPKFISDITQLTGTKWAAISVLAHEIGHHLYGKPSANGKPTLATELEADEFSGYALMKMGATLEEAQAAMTLISGKRAGISHPGRDDRNRSIAKGFKDAGGDVPESALAKTSSQAEMSSEQTTMPISSVAAAIEFTANPDKEYFVTKNMTVVRIDEDAVKAIARITRSNSSSYPYIIYDDTGFRLYVNKTGSIVDRRGNKVGLMKAVTR